MISQKRNFVTLLCGVACLLFIALPSQAQYNYTIDEPLRTTPGSAATFTYLDPQDLSGGINYDFWQPYAYPPTYSGTHGYLTISSSGVDAGGFLVYLGFPNVKWALTGDFRVSFYLETGASAGRMAVAVNEGVPGTSYCAPYNSGNRQYVLVWSSNQSSSPPPAGYYYNMPAADSAYLMFVKEGNSMSIYRGDESGVSEQDELVYGQNDFNADGYFYLYFGTGSPNYAGTMLLRNFVIEAEGLAPCDTVTPIPDEWIANPNLPPTAKAGDDQAIRVGDPVGLDGSESFDDNTATVDLDYSWNIAIKPGGSTAALDDPSSDTPGFVADVAGTYVVELVVTDESGLSSDPDQVEISSDNLAPTAMAGDDELVFIGTAVVLDGSGSNDPEMDTLTFEWTITSAPAGSLAGISNSDMEIAGLMPDLEGVYEVMLTVSDFLGAGEPDSVEIMATTAQDFAENRIMCAADVVSGLQPDQVTTKGNQTALLNFLGQAVAAIQEGNTARAIDKLTKSIERTNGCEVNGSPDGNGPGRDWITDCDAQAQVLSCLREALGTLTP